MNTAARDANAIWKQRRMTVLAIALVLTIGRVMTTPLSSDDALILNLVILAATFATSIVLSFIIHWLVYFAPRRLSR